MTDLELAEGFELDLVLAKVAAVESRSNILLPALSLKPQEKDIAASVD
jgi:hypothetical protein